MLRKTKTRKQNSVNAEQNEWQRKTIRARGIVISKMRSKQTKGRSEETSYGVTRESFGRFWSQQLWSHCANVWHSPMFTVSRSIARYCVYFLACWAHFYGEFLLTAAIRPRRQSEVFPKLNAWPLFRVCVCVWIFCVEFSRKFSETRVPVQLWIEDGDEAHTKWYDRESCSFTLSRKNDRVVQFRINLLKSRNTLGQRNRIPFIQSSSVFFSLHSLPPLSSVLRLCRAIGTHIVISCISCTMFEWVHSITQTRHIRFE